MLDPELSPYHIAALFHFRKRCVLVLVPNAPVLAGMASTEVWCTKSCRAMVPTLREAVVEDYSRCWIRSSDSARQQTADVCVCAQAELDLMSVCCLVRRDVGHVLLSGC